LAFRGALWLLHIALILPLGAAARGEPACVEECGYESEPMLDSVALVQPALLSGPDFKVDPQARVGGYMARFSITTKYGPLSADSTQLLAIRVAEIPAIETLERASQSGAFAHALAERGKKTGNAIVKVITHPVDSITGLPMGVVRYFKKQIDLWAGRAQSASDQSSRRFENKGDPFRAPDGPMTAGRYAQPARISAPVQTNPDSAANSNSEAVNAVEASPDIPPQTVADSAPPKKNRAWYARVGSEVGREAKRYLKYNQARNEMAKYLGIDSNTSNPYVTERLDSLAWAAVGGNFSAGEALGDITGDAAEVITDTGLVNEFVLTHTPEEIRTKNEHSLLTLCSDEFGVRQFLRRGGFNDTLRTQLAESLRKLKPVAGCNELLELGATTRGEIEARYLVNALALIVEYAPDAGGGKLLIVGASLVYQMPLKNYSGGQLILPLPVDYLSWSADIDEFFTSAEFARSGKVVLIGGEASRLAQKKLTARGWSLVLRAPYQGAPDYVKGEFSRTGE
jgi:hypothetical protein